MYGVKFCGVELVALEQLRKRWLMSQRKVFLTVAAAYRTVSYEALWLVCGIEPLDLKVEWRLRVLEDLERSMELWESKEVRREEMMDRWQERWKSSTKGRVTYMYCGDVRESMVSDWRLNHYLCRVLTGHGNFRKSFEMVDSEWCVSCEAKKT